MLLSPGFLQNSYDTNPFDPKQRMSQTFEDYVVWIVGIACVNYVAGVLFTINSARKWRFWWYACLEIPLILIAQIVAVLLVPVGTLKGAIAFSLMTNAGWLLTHLTVGLYGLFINQQRLRRSYQTMATDLSA